MSEKPETVTTFPRKMEYSIAVHLYDGGNHYPVVIRQGDVRGRSLDEAIHKVTKAYALTGGVEESKAVK
jgi:hypothetical protein